MARGKRVWVQCELQLLPGAELWVLVRHRRGHFKLPGLASVQELVEGVQAGWCADEGKRAKVELGVRVPYADWLAYRAWRDQVKGSVQERTVTSTRGELRSSPDRPARVPGHRRSS
jgi:hypothetical protein